MKQKNSKEFKTKHVVYLSISFLNKQSQIYIEIFEFKIWTSLRIQTLTKFIQIDINMNKGNYLFLIPIFFKNSITKVFTNNKFQEKEKKVTKENS